MAGASDSRTDAETIVARFNMREHPEGGYYAETHRSAGTIPETALPAAFAGDRRFSTAILYLLRAGEKSHLHRIRQDEVWHFYLGGTLRLLMISPSGEYEEIRLGHNISEGEWPQFAVPAGSWFGAAPLAGSDYSFVGCTVAPGFEFADFELARKEEMRNAFSNLDQIISEFCM